MGLLSGLASGILSQIINDTSANPAMLKALINNNFDSFLLRKFLAKNAPNLNLSFLDLSDSPPPRQTPNLSLEQALVPLRLPNRFRSNPVTEALNERLVKNSF